jgi:adenylate cyclase
VSDVFISYARSTDRQARDAAEALRVLGYEVWRDDQLPAHRAYSDVIEERLASASAVLVLWSVEAVKSHWVRAEADRAREAGTLVQARLDATVPPMPFNQIQCADLAHWSGDPQAPGWLKVAESIAALAGPRPAAPAKQSRSKLSVCVLPFANMSGDAEQEYFSDGISEDITTDLSQISALAVTARNTAFTYKGRAVDVPAVARALGVSHVLEGSVRKAGSRVRITAQLIDGATGDHLWAERYDRDLNDIFAIQDEISEAIVAALRLKLLPDEKKAIEQRGTTDVEAYNLYLMARQAWISGDFGDPRREERVIRICRRATEIDPDYPQAWALMALAQANLRYGFTGNESLDDGVAAAERALALDPSIAEAHCPMAWGLAEQGRHDEANAEIAMALRLGPQSWEVNKEAARLFYRQRRVEDTVRHLEIACALMESDFHGLGMLFACYMGQNNAEGARGVAERIIAQVEPIVARDPAHGTALIFGALSFAMLGEADRAQAWIERGLLLDPDNQTMRYNLAWGLIAIFHDETRAIDMLEPVFANAGPNVIRLAANDPNLDSLRADPKFQQMLEAARKRTAQ